VNPDLSMGRRRCGAFTLIEVVVALVIFSFAGFVLAAAFVNVLNAQESSLRRDLRGPDLQLVRAALFAESDLTKAAQWNDLVLPDGRKARWQATVTPANLADLFDVVLEIEFSEAGGTKTDTVTETCRLLRPTWSQAADRETLRAAARSKLAKRTYQ